MIINQLEEQPPTMKAVLSVQFCAFGSFTLQILAILFRCLLKSLKLYLLLIKDFNYGKGERFSSFFFFFTNILQISKLLCTLLFQYLT